MNLEGMPTMAPPKNLPLHEYERNLLESLANWLRTRAKTPWAEGANQSALMLEYADGLDRIRGDQSTMPSEAEIQEALDFGRTAEQHLR